MRGPFGNWGEARGFGHGMGRDEEHGEPRGSRHWHGGGRGHGRPFDHGELRLVILAMIAEKPRHGYEIIKAIEDGFGGSYSPSPGVVYPTLTMLEEMGKATVEENGGKKLYTITEEGRAYLAANQRPTDTAMERMRDRLHGRGPAPQMIRAMANLKMALRLRHGNGPLTEEQIHNIVAALDNAAITIERS